jgi:hypothetical protein
MGPFRFLGLLALIGGLAGVLPPITCSLHAQQTSPPPEVLSRLVGSVVSVQAQAITVKQDSGSPATVKVSDSVRVLETKPGAKNIAGATTIHLTDVAVGDRVLVALQTTADGAPALATTIVVMRQADIAKEHEAETADWQTRGMGGIVKSVDAAAGTVTISRSNNTVTIHTSPKTVIRRYDPGSIKFSDTKISSLDQILPGDQLRARGDRSADGAEMQAEEIVAGSFRNIAGSVVSTDAAANTVTVTDFKTKKPLVIQMNADSQLHKLDPAMAQGIAAQFKSENGSQEPGTQGAHPHAGGASHASDPTAPSGAAPAGGSQVSTEPGGERHHRGNLSQMLQRAPVIQLADLHHGDAVMIVATQAAAGSLTACTLLAGVEPILNASPSAGQNLFSASWNLGGQGGGGGDAAGGP